MKIIAYRKNMGQWGSNLQQKLLMNIDDADFQLHDVFSSLHNELCRPLNNVSVVIICPDTKGDLDQLLTLKPFLENKKVIAVLPETMQLYPSFISYQDNDFDNLLMVLEKIKQSYTNNRLDTPSGPILDN